MLIEILQESDIYRVEDVVLKSYLMYSLERLPEGFDYYNHIKEYGYFVVVTELEDLIGTCIKLNYFELPPIDTHSFFEQVELIETKTINGTEVMEILIHVDTDITVSLIFRKEILNDETMEMVNKF